METIISCIHQTLTVDRRPTVDGHRIRKTAVQMARMLGVSPPTVSRIVAAHGP